jgi:hypothetical protein
LPTPSELVERDVADTLGRWFEPMEADHGFRMTPTFNAGEVVEATAGAATYTLARWQWKARHTRDISNYDGVGVFVRATGNTVTVQGLHIIEKDAAGRETVRRYIDWLSVYAQLGVVFAGRPVGLTDTTVFPAPRSRRPEPQPK